ncbi:uncharacterized protein LOC122627796 [Vespula pensylvanica]|uniref:uncharacterized protein LOC122627796 n=1 Tax=Vespula pensylvanica TaxID=30213 RepID=UPI001CB9F956|nr:uncharacterized protein LOC122627796 [Vespula pensylvanica]XP_043665278.1 uncharacterized protein LOC122627796 [Vespula pensylvanica]
MGLSKIVLILLLAEFSHARPQTTETETSLRQEITTETSNKEWKPPRSTGKTTENVRRGDSSVQLTNETQRQLKDLQHINQSLRTVATQLLNVTGHNEGVKDTKIERKDSRLNGENDASFVKEINAEISNLESMGVNFGRPMNSKFGYFESSHPGQAMVMTEEELEKEMSSTRLMAGYKNHPTTTGGISTWILLNPPSTTIKSLTDNDQPGTTKQSENDVRYTLKPIVTHGRIEVKNTKNEQKVTSQLPSTASIEKVIFPSTKKAANNSTLKKSNAPGNNSSKQDETTQSLAKLEAIESTTSKISRTTVSSPADNKVTSESTSSTATTKKIQIIRSTLKAKPTTTPRPTVPNKSATTVVKRPQQGKPKPSQTRRTTVKPDVSKNDNSTTAKVEKVTFKAVPMITTPRSKNEITEKPIFVTKIKASVLMDTQKTAPIATTNVDVSTVSKSNFSDADLVEVPIKSKPLGTSINNVLKVQLKKPIDESTQIEIEPIKMNPPVLTIQKMIEKKPDNDVTDIGLTNLNGSSIDLKFDFNPELTKISTEVESLADSVTTSAPSSTTTKRQRNSNKRKKNKIRRRRPSSTTPLTSTTITTTTTTIAPVPIEEINEVSAEPILLDNAIQESKIEPESKITNNITKTKKKPPQKGISTQIYNFLSREVMPSFGVMSLLGLGLGLASYFLYPFGGTITRRNYEVEPNYKYNLDEYGGNYGQNEEEVLSKVLQGMTNHENKFGAGSGGVKDFDKNYYRYQHFDGAYDTQSIRRTDQRYPLPSSSPIYKPTENTASVLKYRNTDYRYSEVQTTPTYYDPQKHNEFVVGQDSTGNRQFVVGNIPKEYPPFTDKHLTLPTSDKKGPNVFHESTESGLTQFERDIAQGLNFPPNSVNGHGYQSETQTLRPEDGYEEIEITPTAVAVEHGPRSLKIKRSILNRMDVNRSSRSKRDSVIQIIPSRHELEKEQKEEDFSNEILDIIDSALPGSEEKKIIDNEVDDFLSYKKKLHGESQQHHKEIGSRNEVQTSEIENDTNSNKNLFDDTAQTVEKITTEKQIDKIEEYSSNDSFVTSTSSSTSDESDTTEHVKDIEETTVEWFENTTTKKSTEEEGGFNIFSFVKKVAEIKFRLGLTILKHASEGFARYLGHVQKRINGEE